MQSASAKNIGRIVTTEYWPDREGSGLYRPVTTLSYLFNYAILGNAERQEGYHWINYVLHAVNTTLVFALGLVIFESASWALALAAIWTVHPILTESVTNIVGRADLLAALGVLIGLHCYLKGRAAGRAAFAWTLGLAGGAAVGLFSKENAVVLIPLMVLCDVARPVMSSVARRAQFYGAAGLVCAAFVVARTQLHSQFQIQFIDNPLAGAGFWNARLTAAKVALRYMWLFVCPVNLSADYSFNSIHFFKGRITGWEDVSLLVAALALVLIVLTLLRWPRTTWALCMGFVLIALLPTSNLILLVGTIMAERFAYLPSIGMAACVVLALRALCERAVARWRGARQLAWLTISLIVIVLASRTYARNRDWLDDASLWTSAVSVCSQSAKAHLNLGRVFWGMPGRLSDAIAEYQAALRIEPEYPLAHYNLATALVSAGRFDEAILHYQAAVRLEPNFPQGHNNLGNLLARTPERLPQAIEQYRAALRLDPNYAEAHLNLGNALISMPGETSAAIGEYREALRIQPDLATAHYDIGTAILQTGHLEDAVAEFRLAIRIEPDFAPAHDALGVALVQIPGHLQDAIGEFTSAIRDNPGLANPHLHLGRALAQAPGRLGEAVGEFESALRIDPQMASAHYQLGMALLKSPETHAQGIQELEIAQKLLADVSRAR